MRLNRSGQAIAGLHEAETDLWLWNARLEGLTYDQIVYIAPQAKPRGLGRTISISTVNRRLKARLEERRALGDQARDDWVIIRLDRLEMLYAEYRLMAEPTFIVDGEVKMTPASTRFGALAGMAAVGRDLDNLLGLKAVVKVEADITMRDPVTDALNEMLNRAGFIPETIDEPNA